MILDIPSWKHSYGHNTILIWRKMPARSCGRRNISPRFQLVEASLAPGKSRTGNHQLPPQIHHQYALKMLNKGSSSSVSGKPEACTHRWERRRHASDLNPGFVTFVGMRSNVFIMVRSWLMKRGVEPASPHALSMVFSRVR